MQFIAVWLKQYLLRDKMSLNDICCYIPAWFGVVTTILTGLIAYECTIAINANQNLVSYLFRNRPGSRTSSSSSSSPAMECCIMTMLLMSIVPAHLMRSMGGGYDNESVAVTAMVLTFYCWIRSLRSTNTMVSTIIIAILTGLSYFYMVAAWGGYVFVLNLIGVHAAVLVGLGRFTNKIYIAYTLFYVIGTTLAIQVPVVGYAPLKSLEQLGPCAVFIAYQLLVITEQMIQSKRQSSTKPITWTQAMTIRVQVFSIAAVIGLICAMILLPTGYFGPISSRVRGLFVKHTKTGNPLVDSVAEHQPASTRAYFDYLHHICSIAPIGYILVALLHMSDTSSFLLVWGASAYYFSLKMVRLVLLTAPIACILGGIVAGRVIAWCIAQWWDPPVLGTSSLSNSSPSDHPKDDTIDDIDGDEFDPPVTQSKNGARAAMQNRNKSKKSKGGMKKSTLSSDDDLFSVEGIDKLRSAYDMFAKSKEGVISKRLVSVLLLLAGYVAFQSFVTYSWRLSYDLSHPTIIQKARTREGQVIVLDDYRDAYWWIRDNTPKDSRIMAWWDCTFRSIFSNVVQLFWDRSFLFTIL
jgi:dolichyl-diphosphooligosaccharide--protein glycosyltransferase